MSRRVVAGLVTVLCMWVLVAEPVIGHHSLASEFDVSKPVTLTGTVTKIEWTNPHGRFFLDVRDTSGAVVAWEIEQGSVNALMRNGWTRNTLKVGDVVTVNGLLARETPHLAAASNAPASITLADGRTYLPGTKLVPAPGR